MRAQPALADALDPAPFLADLAQAPVGARATWIQSADGLRLRTGLLGRGDRGTVLLLQGRTEYLEKYGLAAQAFAARGYGTVSVDFRGQGRSERMLGDSPLGHIDDFANYQHDVQALVRFAEAMGMPRPWFVVAHSMGGAIGLRALIEDRLPVQGAVFSAPLWGIQMPAVLRPVAHALGWLARRVGRDERLVPGLSPTSYVRGADPGDNMLTSDPDMVAYMRSHLEADPALDLGGPTLAWLDEALAECRKLMAAPLPATPALIFLPERETIVSKAAMRQMAARWPGSELIEVPGGRHETMMETANRREDFFARSTGFFDAHRG
ncbi:MAG: alpha/beta fold hydrolase [Qingshengfaniella sp.]